jgi:hypothetical protein
MRNAQKCPKIAGFCDRGEGTTGITGAGCVNAPLRKAHFPRAARPPNTRPKGYARGAGVPLAGNIEKCRHPKKTSTPILAAGLFDVYLTTRLKVQRGVMLSRLVPAVGFNPTPLQRVARAPTERCRSASLEPRPRKSAVSNFNASGLAAMFFHLKGTSDGKTST